MSAQFPPSSPIAASESRGEDPFYQPDGKHLGSTLDFFKKKTGASNVVDYPTPNPSSTLGKSSPVKARPACDTSFQTPSECELEEELRLEIESSKGAFKSQPLEVSLDAHFETRVSIGRKNTLCDVILPRHKNISRLHAFVTYMPETKQVKVECKGTNGLVVAFPVKLDVKLFVCLKPENTFKLADMAETGLKNCQVASKELVLETGLTSFVILQGETVYMPFVEHTILDFRQIECELRVRDHSSTRFHDVQNETETEDELQPLGITSDDFSHEMHTPVKDAAQVPSQGTPSSKLQKHHLDHERSLPPLAKLIFEETKSGTLEDPNGCEKQLSVKGQKAPLLPQIQNKIEKSADTTTIKGDSAQTGQDIQKIHSKKNTELPMTPRKQLQDSAQNLPDRPSSPVKKLDGNSRRRKYTSPSPKKTAKRKSKPQKPKLTNDEILSKLVSQGFDVADLQHVLANHLAFSNIQQVPFYQLRQVNSTVSTMKPFELRALLETEKCIGVIYREGKDAAGKPLDEEYYYDLENDTDDNRRQVVSSLKGGRSGLRSCRRVHKQYFWKKPTM
ncbi:LADA_0H01728g1_1 [Lachancea dasiensis]|uniref:LADA_0H01728g1_1 n=1 Tax=Lachancea dasiensis TaxID=1072105 RepID=A0A1G4JZF4_9SACH|nr:LADA_0H01728g1_1 [Lachancea dasiensis]